MQHAVVPGCDVLAGQQRNVLVCAVSDGGMCMHQLSLPEPDVLYGSSVFHGLLDADGSGEVGVRGGGGQRGGAVLQPILPEPSQRQQDDVRVADGSVHAVHMRERSGTDGIVRDVGGAGVHVERHVPGRAL